MPFKFAVFTDAHANLPALDAVLQTIAAEGCDAIYHTGDAIGFGPYPAEVLDCLLHTPKPHLLMGNHDELFAFGLPEPLPTWMSAGEVEHQRWVHAQLEPSLRAVVAAWPYVIEETVHDVSMTFTHYARKSGERGFADAIYSPTPDDLDRLFARNPTTLIFYGHHHAQSDIYGRSRSVNPGALGAGPIPLARFVTV